MTLTGNEWTGIVVVVIGVIAIVAFTWFDGNGY